MPVLSQELETQKELQSDCGNPAIYSAGGLQAQLDQRGLLITFPGDSHKHPHDIATGISLEGSGDFSFSKTEMQTSQPMEIQTPN